MVCQHPIFLLVVHSKDVEYAAKNYALLIYDVSMFVSSNDMI